MTVEHYDVIIIGSGAGGGTLCHELASTGKKNSIDRKGPLPSARKRELGSKIGLYR